MLDWVGREVAFAFGAAGVVAVYFFTADEDWVSGAFCPVDVGGRVDGGFDVRTVEIGGGAFGGVDELGGEGDDVPEERALLVYFVNVEAGIDCQGGIINHVEDITGGLAGVIEEHGWLVSGRWEGEIFLSYVGISAGFVKAFELSKERVIELEHGLVLQNEGHGGNLFLSIIELADAGVVD